MEALMTSSSPYLKLSFCRDQNRGFLCLKDDLLSRAPPLHHFHNNKKNKDVDLKLSLSFSSTSGVFCPISFSSSHNQAEVKNQELQLEESLKINSNEVEAQTIHVKFQLQRECAFGQHFLMVGDDPVLGLWDPNNAIPLTWSDGHVWTVELDIPVGKCIKFKFVMHESKGKFMWQPGPDRILEFWEMDKTITLCEDWENPDLRTIIEAGSKLNQTEESTETPGKQIVADNLSVPVVKGESSVTTGSPNMTKKSKPTTMENLGDSEVNKTKEPIEPKGYTFELKERLITHEGVPVLVAGLSPLPTTDTDQEEELMNEAPTMSTRAKPATQKDEVELTNGAALVSAGADMAKDLKLPELDSKEEHVNNSSNLTQRTEITLIDETQESCDNPHQETQELAQEQDDQTTQPMKSLFLNNIEWGKNTLQKILNSLRIQ